MMEVRTDLPLLEPKGDEWVVQGRGEPLVLRSKPGRPKKPEAVRVHEKTAERTARAGRWSRPTRRGSVTSSLHRLRRQPSS